MNTAVEEGQYEGFDGSELFFQSWPKTSPKALIIGIHGLGEHVESYKRLAEGLQDTSYQFFMSDLRGHGRSSGKRGSGSIDEFVLDNKIFIGKVRERFPNLPFFLLGHSMGGLILTKLLIRNGSLGAKGAVLSSPLFGVAVKIPFIKERSAGLLKSLLPNIGLSNEIPNSHLTHDRGVIEEYESDHLRHNRITPRLFIDMLESMKYVFENKERLSLPLLLQQAAEDFVVSQPKAEELFDGLDIKDKQKIIYEGFYHEIYNEVGRHKPFTDLIKWMDKHLA
jgi:alpha-beta hydrolase superfamily lysophospholipase